MKRILLVTMGLALAASAGVADPGNDESVKSREKSARELRFDREFEGERPRRAVRAFREEYDDGRCRVERKLDTSGQYKEEIECRPGRS
jgi:hypothetical protein